MKIIYKIKIHIFFYIVFLLSILTGNFKLFISLTFIILFHELGHILLGTLFKWKIDRVIILPFSSITIFNTSINKPIYEELLVTLFGPLFQILLLLFIKEPILLKYNLYLLIFNLLPIYPLDGYKLFQILLSNIIPYKRLLTISLYISIIFIFILIYLLNNNTIIIFISLLFLFKTIKEFNNKKYIFNKFILERYLYNYSFKNITLKGNSLNKFYKYKYHYFIKNNKIYNEKEIISNYMIYFI